MTRFFENPASGPAAAKGKTAWKTSNCRQFAELRPAAFVFFGFTLIGCGGPRGGSLPSSTSASPPVQSLTFSADGKWLAAGRGSFASHGSRPWTGTGGLSVWGVAEWKRIIATQAGFTSPVEQVRVIDSRIVVAVADKYVETKGNPKAGVSLRSWSLDESKEESESVLRDCRSPARGVGMSTDARLVIYSSFRSYGIHVYELPSVRLKMDFEPTGGGRAGESRRPNLAMQCVFVAGAKRIIARMEEQPTVQCFDASDGKQLHGADPGGSRTILLDAALDGAKVAAVGKDGRMRVLNGDLEVIKDLGDVWMSAPGVPPPIGLARSGSWLAVASGPEKVDLFDLRRGERVRTVEGFGEGITSLAVSDRGLLAIGCGGYVRGGGVSSGVVYVVEIASGRTVTKLE